MQILLVGCSGFVGRELVPLLLGQGHGLSLLSRQARPLPTISNSALERLQGDPSQAATWQQPELQAALARAEAVINLAGEPIAEKRWTPAQRQLLFDSRVATTGHLVAALSALAAQPEQPRPSVVINGSDAADALAVAICHAHHSATQRRIAGATVLAGARP